MRLDEIDKEELAADVLDRVVGHHSTRLLFDVGPDSEVRVARTEWRATSVGRAAALLCHYAQTGEPPGDAPVSEYLQTYCEALYTRPGDCGSYDVPPLDQVRGEPEAEHEIVLVAAVARDIMERDEPLSLLHLAVLSGVSYQYVRRLASTGEIRTSGARGAGVRSVAASEARRWLGARGVVV